jgi:hypothetical protein
VPLKMLKMRGRTIMAGLVCAHPPTTLATSLTPRRGKLKYLFNRDRHPTFPIPKFAIYGLWHGASMRSDQTLPYSKEATVSVCLSIIKLFAMPRFAKSCRVLPPALPDAIFRLTK